MAVFMKSRRTFATGNLKYGETRHPGAEETANYCRPFDSGLVQALAFDNL